MDTPISNLVGGREGHSAVWNGAGMVVWGGHHTGQLLNNGGTLSRATQKTYYLFKKN